MTRSCCCLSNLCLLCPICLAGSVFDYLLSRDGVSWVPWSSTVPDPKFDQPGTHIIIPTTESVRMSYLLDFAIANQMKTLLVGPTGTGAFVPCVCVKRFPTCDYFASWCTSIDVTHPSKAFSHILICTGVSRMSFTIWCALSGKTTSISSKLLRGLPNDKFTAQIINLSAASTSEMTQQTIDRRVGVFVYVLRDCAFVCFVLLGLFGYTVSRGFIFLCPTIGLSFERCPASSPQHIIRRPTLANRYVLFRSCFQARKAPQVSVGSSPPSEDGRPH